MNNIYDKKTNFKVVSFPWITYPFIMPCKISDHSGTYLSLGPIAILWKWKYSSYKKYIYIWGKTYQYTNKLLEKSI